MSLCRSTIRRVRRPLLAALLALAAPLSSFAHDPYEITATAYLWTNRVDLNVAMEFRTGLRLAGVEPRPPAGVSTTNWFAENRAALLASAKSFCQVQSGSNLLPIRSVEVALGVEDHIEMRMEYPPATERPLRFDAAGLKALAGQGQYGVVLTVLDMVNGKVLGQPVLFADAPTLAVEIPAFTETGMISSGPAAAAKATTVSASLPTALDSTTPPEKPVGNLIVPGLISGVAALLLLAVVWRRQRVKS